MGGGCACQSTIKNYFFGTSDFILSHDNSVNNIAINNKSKMPEQNIRIIPKEDYEGMNIFNIKDNIVQYDKTKINKINISKNNNNLKLINASNNNEDNTKKIFINKNNSSSFEELCSGNSKKNNNKDNNKNKIHNITHEDKIIKTTNNNQNITKKIMENDNNIKKADTNYNYNLGEHNFIFINISQGNSIMKNETSKFESITPQSKNLEITKGKKKLFSHFCKNKINEKPEKNQSIINNINLKQENIHIQLYMNDYSEEMLNFINSIRKNPESFIQYIDNDIIKNIQKTNDDIYIVSKNINEKIKLMEDYLLIFDKIKNILKEIIKSKKSKNLKDFIYNKELEIVLDKSHDLIINRSHIQRSSISNDNDNNVSSNIISKNQLLKNKISNLNLSDEKIANLILEKRKQIKDKYPDILFKLNIIKDIKISILIQISFDLLYNQYNNETMLKGIIFNPKYQYFAVSWANEINRNFISITCFA